MGYPLPINVLAGLLPAGVTISDCEEMAFRDVSPYWGTSTDLAVCVNGEREYLVPRAGRWVTVSQKVALS